MRNFNKRGLKCGVCGRTFNEHSSDHVCPECFEVCGYDNEVNDHGPEAFTPAVAVHLSRQLALIAKKGGDIERVKAANDYIDWSKVPAPTATRTINRVGSNAPTNGVKAPVRVEYDGKNESYKSLYVAFCAVGLPLSKMQKFRVQLKLAGELVFEYNGKAYRFFAAGR